MGPLIADIPDLFDREIVRRQFHILHARFKGDVELGCDPSGASSELLGLWDLTENLIHGTGE